MKAMLAVGFIIGLIAVSPLLFVFVLMVIGAFGALG